MSMRGTIRFEAYSDVFYVTHEDGHTERVFEDMERLLTVARRRWNKFSPGRLVTLLIAPAFDTTVEEALPSYTICSGFNGGDVFRYFVKWDVNAREWLYGELEEFDPGTEPDLPAADGIDPNLNSLMDQIATLNDSLTSFRKRYPDSARCAGK